MDNHNPCSGFEKGNFVITTTNHREINTAKEILYNELINDIFNEKDTVLKTKYTELFKYLNNDLYVHKGTKGWKYEMIKNNFNLMKNNIKLLSSCLIYIFEDFYKFYISKKKNNKNVQHLDNDLYSPRDVYDFYINLINFNTTIENLTLHDKFFDTHININNELSQNFRIDNNTSRDLESFIFNNFENFINSISKDYSPYRIRFEVKKENEFQNSDYYIQLYGYHKYISQTLYQTFDDGDLYWSNNPHLSFHGANSKNDGSRFHIKYHSDQGKKKHTVNISVSYITRSKLFFVNLSESWSDVPHDLKQEFKRIIQKFIRFLNNIDMEENLRNIRIDSNVQQVSSSTSTTDSKNSRAYRVDYEQGPISSTSNTNTDRGQEPLKIRFDHDENVTSSTSSTSSASSASNTNRIKIKPKIISLDDSQRWEQFDQNRKQENINAIKDRIITSNIQFYDHFNISQINDINKLQDFENDLNNQIDCICYNQIKSKKNFEKIDKQFSLRGNFTGTCDLYFQPCDEHNKIIKFVHIDATKHMYQYHNLIYSNDERKRAVINTDYISSTINDNEVKKIIQDQITALNKKLKSINCDK